jgi:hypothetical protein
MLNPSQKLSGIKLLGLAALCALLIFPSFLKGHLISHDLLYHLHWNELFLEQFHNGDLYPRWLFQMNAGRGSPVFFFYSPLPYFSSALLYTILSGEEAHWYAMGATCFSALLISAIGVYLFLKDDTDTQTATLFTILYVLSPYYLFVDLYVRFAFAEFFAIAVIPFLFLTVRQLAQRRRYSGCWFSLCYSLLILSHIPSTLLLTPVLLGYYMVETSTLKPSKLLVSMFIGGLMTAFYFVPVLFLRADISMEQMNIGRGYFENTFLLVGDKLFPDWGDLWRFLNQLAVTSGLLLLLSIAANARTRKRWYFAMVSGVALFMMYPISAFVWKALPPLQLVQFPWRFFIVLSFTLLFCVAKFCSEGKIATHALPRYLRKAMLSILIGLSVATLMNCYLYANEAATEEQQALIDKTLITRPGADEYLPRWVPHDTASKVHAKTIEKIGGWFSSDQPDSHIVSEFDGQNFTLDLSTDRTTQLTFNQFFFPSWQCVDLESGKELSLGVDQAGLVQLSLAAGRHRLVFRQKLTRYEQAGLLLSLFGLVLLGWQYCRQRASLPEPD